MSVIEQVSEHLSNLSPTQERYTFPSSGITVTIQRVSAQMLADYRIRLRRKNPPPVPPKQTVNIAGENVESENPSDPDYQAALAKYEVEMGKREFEYFIGNTLVLSDTDRQLIKEYRDFQLSHWDVTFDEPDWYVFLWHLAALDPKDFDEFQRIALSMSRPTREAVENAKATFRGVLRQSANLGDTHT